MTSSHSKDRLKLKIMHEKKPCFWMQAEVVRRRFCETDYDCVNCRFDRVLRKAAGENRRRGKGGLSDSDGKKTKIVFWKDKLNDLPASQRPCIHHMRGAIEFRACTNAYRCRNCEFDQYFDDQFSVHAVVKPVDILEVEGFRIPQGFYLHGGHAWVKIEEGGTVRVGLDDFALRVLGPFERIIAPLTGKTVEQGQPGITLIRGQNEARLAAPVSGVVTDINAKLREPGNLLDLKPYSEGWFLRVHCEDLRRDLKHLMIADETEAFLQQDVDDLYQMMEDTVPLAADGGRIANDIFGHMPELGWDRLTRRFLGTGRNV